MIHRLFYASAAVTVLGALTGSDGLQRIAKPMIVPSLALGLAPRPNTILLTGLAAATLGDVLLIDPDDDAKLTNGAAAFAVMHACYSVLLIERGAQPNLIAALPRLTAWVLAAATMQRRSPATAPALTGYGLILTATATLAADPRLDSDLQRGGLLFTVSDSLIMVRRLFLRGQTSRGLCEAGVLATYAAAQMLLVEGLSR